MYASHLSMITSVVSQSEMDFQYGDKLSVFKSEIPLAIKAAETSAEGKSIYAYDRNGKAAVAYEALTKEVLSGGKQREKYEADISR